MSDEQATTDDTPRVETEPDSSTPDDADTVALLEGAAARIAELEAALAASEAASAATIADLKARNYDLMVTGVPSEPEHVEDTGDDLSSDDSEPEGFLDDYL